MVRSLARRYARSSGASAEDLESEGYVGLVQAAQKYQPKRGVQFATFAAPRIRGAMLDALRRDSLLSRPMASHVSRLKAEVDTLPSRLGREPTEDELAGALHLPAERTRKVLGYRGLTVTSLEQNVEELGPRLADARPSPEDQAVGKMLMHELQHYMQRLRPQDREIIERIYWRHQKQTEVADALGISASRVSQRRARAIKLLRQMIAVDGGSITHYLRAA
jgi:RNA polymerase sigma factor for flagellar operon FliA